MLLLLKDKPVLEVKENGQCTILEFDFLPLALRKENISLADFMEWASNRTLSIGRSYAKEILNRLHLSQSNRYAVCKACRGLSLEDSYWIRQDGDDKKWEDVNLFHNPLCLFITEISLSGRNHNYKVDVQINQMIHTPELTTLGASAKGWIRHEDGLHLHKVGKYEIPAGEILDALAIEHIPYMISSEENIRAFLTDDRKEWLQGVGEEIVHSKLFTSEELSMVTFEEFSIFCRNYGLNPYEEAKKVDRNAYLKMQIADYILNNNDRHEQNWGFLMENSTGKIVGFCPLFDHDHTFALYDNVLSQTTEENKTLLEAAMEAQAELQMDLVGLFQMKCPSLLNEKQWGEVLDRAKRIL